MKLSSLLSKPVTSNRRFGYPFCSGDRWQDFRGSTRVARGDIGFGWFAQGWHASPRQLHSLARLCCTREQFTKTPSLHAMD